MQTNKNRPNWWKLYLIFPMVFVLFGLDSRLNITPGVHEMVQLGCIVLILSFVYIWLNDNSDALSRMDQTHSGGRISGFLFENRPTHPTKNGPYFRFRSRNTPTEGPLRKTITKDYDEAGISLHEDVSQEMDKE